MSKGYFVLTLHAHLPYINHPDFSEFMEEKWLFEAISETYLPLLKVFKRLKLAHVPYKVTMSITPPLMEMFSNTDLKRKYLSHLTKLIDLSEKEVKRTATEHPRKHKMAEFYLEDFKALKKLYESINGDIVSAFTEFQRDGNLEIITCNATHGFLPLMARYPEAVNAQIKLGVETYRKHTGSLPKGIWLAECGYTPGIDEYLKKHDLSFFFVDSHALWLSEPAARYGVYRPVITPSGVFAFARDPESSQQVWSAEIGYPGDSRYREFYRDVGFDREDWYVAPYVDPSGERHNTGIKYHKITSKDVSLNQKDYYDIDEARQAVKEHAHDFAMKKRDQVLRLSRTLEGVEPVIVAPFDAELYGHWWFEGPYFIEEFFRAIASVKELIPATPSEVINTIDTAQEVIPAASTWGANGYNEVWLNGKNDWIYRHLDEMVEKMVVLAREYYHERDELKIRALNQMARELLLAQSSDWAFIITTGTTVEYAVTRTKTHIKRFNDLLEKLRNNSLDPEELKTLEWIDGIFKDIDYRIYAG